MDCTKVNEWLLNRPLTSNDIPDEINRHIAKCSACKQLFEEDRYLAQNLSNIKNPEMTESFWNTYLTELNEKIGNVDKNTKSVVIGKRRKLLTLPFAAVLLLAAFLFTSDKLPLTDNEVYSNSMEFIWEEHDNVSSEYMLGSFDFIMVDEIIPEASSGKN